MIIDGKRASDRAIELVLEYCRTFNRRDWEGLLALLADDVAHDVNQGQREIGRDAFRAYVERLDRCHAALLRNIIVTATPDGMHAAAEYIVHGEYRVDDPLAGGGMLANLPPARGQSFVLPGGAFFDLRDGRIVRLTNYNNVQDWLRQVAK